MTAEQPYPCSCHQLIQAGQVIECQIHGLMIGTSNLPRNPQTGDGTAHTVLAGAPPVTGRPFIGAVPSPQHDDTAGESDRAAVYPAVSSQTLVPETEAPPSDEERDGAGGASQLGGDDDASPVSFTARHQNGQRP